MTEAAGGGPQRVVLDTNVVLDWLVFRDPGVLPLVTWLERGELVWLATPGMRQELLWMLDHPSLARWTPDRDRALGAFDAHTTICEPAPTAAGLRCTDADDQPFIDLAVAGRARWLLSHDRAVLKLARRLRGHGVEVLRPSDWSKLHGAPTAVPS
jgi:putative PIN family toxin of toxin-antitoxin system